MKIVPPVRCEDITMKLTSTIIESSPTYINPSNQYTLTLRNSNLTVIDEFPTSYNFDAIDLTNNSIVEITPSTTVKVCSLIVNNNHELHRLDSQAFPILESLSVIDTNIGWLEVQRWKFPHLKHVVALGTPVLAMQHYRLMMIKQFPSIEVIDFERVKHWERQAAATTLVGGQQIDEEFKQALVDKLHHTNDLHEIETIERMLSGIKSSNPGDNV